MNETMVKLAQIAWFAIPVLAALWVWRDADRRKREGFEVNPFAWSFCVLVIWPLSLPLYLIQRRRLSRSDPALEGKNPPEDLLAFGVGAFFLALALSMVATWMIIARYPAQDDAFALGLLGTLFVLFFVLVFLPRLVGLKTREGSRRAAVRWGMGFVLKGVLAAPLVGVSLWLLHRLATEHPWAPSFLIWVVLGLLASKRIWLARSSRGRAANGSLPPASSN